MGAIEAAGQASLAILETVVACGSVPSGHLYARLMGIVSLDVYNAIISALVKAEMITNRGHLLEPTDKGRRLIEAGRPS